MKTKTKIKKRKANDIYLSSIFKSKLEVYVFKFLKRNKLINSDIKSTYEIKVFPIIDKNEEIKFFSQPDFYVKKYNTFLEVKSSLTYKENEGKFLSIFKYFKNTMVVYEFGKPNSFFFIERNKVFNCKVSNEQIKSLIKDEVFIKVDDKFIAIKFLETKYLVIIDPKLNKMKKIKTLLIQNRKINSNNFIIGKTIQDEDK